MVNKLAEPWPNTRTVTVTVTVIQHGKIVGEYVCDNKVDSNQLCSVYSVTP